MWLGERAGVGGGDSGAVQSTHNALGVGQGLRHGRERGCGEVGNGLVWEEYGGRPARYAGGGVGVYHLVTPASTTQALFGPSFGSKTQTTSQTATRAFVHSDNVGVRSFAHGFSLHERGEESPFRVRAYSNACAPWAPLFSPGASTSPLLPLQHHTRTTTAPDSVTNSPPILGRQHWGGRSSVPAPASLQNFTRGMTVAPPLERVKTPFSPPFNFRVADDGRTRIDDHRGVLHDHRQMPPLKLGSPWPPQTSVDPRAESSRSARRISAADDGDLSPSPYKALVRQVLTNPLDDDSLSPVWWSPGELPLPCAFIKLPWDRDRDRKKDSDRWPTTSPTNKPHSSLSRAYTRLLPSKDGRQHPQANAWRAYIKKMMVDQICTEPFPFYLLRYIHFVHVLQPPLTSTALTSAKNMEREERLAGARDPFAESRTIFSALQALSLQQHFAPSNSYVSVCAHTETRTRCHASTNSDGTTQTLTAYKQLPSWNELPFTYSELFADFKNHLIPELLAAFTASSEPRRKERPQKLHLIIAVDAGTNNRENWSSVHLRIIVHLCAQIVSILASFLPLMTSGLCTEEEARLSKQPLLSFQILFYLPQDFSRSIAKLREPRLDDRLDDRLDGRLNDRNVPLQPVTQTIERRRAESTDMNFGRSRIRLSPRNAHTHTHAHGHSAQSHHALSPDYYAPMYPSFSSPIRSPTQAFVQKPTHKCHRFSRAALLPTSKINDGGAEASEPELRSTQTSTPATLTPSSAPSRGGPSPRGASAGGILPSTAFCGLRSPAMQHVNHPFEYNNSKQ